MPPEVADGMSVIHGSAPVRKIRSYQRSVTAYTHGLGKLTCSFKGYDECVNPEEVIAEIGYNCDGDIENTADSVFCEHGAGFSVPWHQVTDYMHLDSIFKEKAEEVVPKKIVRKSATICSLLSFAAGSVIVADAPIANLVISILL